MTRKCVTVCFLAFAMLCGALCTATAWGETDCPSQGLLTVQEGVSNILTSPNYPGRYGNNESCGWQLTAEEGQRVHLCIMDLKVQYGRNCQYDGILLYDGGEPVSHRVLATLCGRSSEPEYYSSGHQMYIKFISNYRVRRRGFKLQYTAVGNATTTAMTTTTTATTNTTTTTTTTSSSSSSQSCPEDGLLIVEENVEKTLTSPNYPNKYNNDEDCGWKLRAEEGKRVRLSVLDIYLERFQENCEYDGLVIYDGGRTWSGSIIATLCSRKQQLEYFSSGHEMYIWFYSDFLLTNKGFKLQYTAVENTTVTSTVTPATTTTPSISTTISPTCLRGRWPDFSTMQNLTAMAGYNSTLTSPNYTWPYPTDQYCGWRIKAPTSWSIVRLYIMYIDMENSPYCGYDSLSFYDGGHNLLNKYCGRYQQVQVRDYGSDVLIKFKCENICNTGRWFNLHYTSIPRLNHSTTLAPTTVAPGQFRCGRERESSYSHERVVTAEIVRNKTLMSPNYPYSYDNQYCGWKIKAEREGYVVRVYVVALKLDSSCFLDSLSLYDSDTAASDRLLRKMCGDRLDGESYYSSGRYMYVQFKTGWVGSIKGFKLLYSAVKRLSGPTTDKPGYVTTNLHALSAYKYLQSDGYPSAFYWSERRIWNISCQPGYTIQLRVDDMDLQDSNICTVNNTMVVFNSDGHTIIARICNYQFNGVDMYSTMGRFMHVRLTSTFTSSGKKFRLRYRAVHSSQAFNDLSTRAPTTAAPPDRSKYNYAFIIAGVIGGCAILGVFICVFCRACLRSKTTPRPRVGRLSTVTFRSGPTSASANGGVYTVPSSHPPATPLDGFTNLAYSEGPPAYSSLQPNLPIFLPAPGVSPDPTQLGVAPPTYTEAMELTHPPSCGKEECDGACAQPKSESSPLPTDAVASASPAASAPKPEEPKLGSDSASDSII